METERQYGVTTVRFNGWYAGSAEPWFAGKPDGDWGATRREPDGDRNARLASEEAAIAWIARSAPEAKGA